MAKRILLSIITGAFIALTTQTVLAADMPNTSLPMSTVIKNLQAKGYHIIRKVEFDDDAYKAEIIDATGKEVKVRINPQTGEITNPKENPVGLSILDITKKVEAAGYHNIYKVESDGGKYEVKALDKDNKKAELKINANSGEISKEGWFD